MQFLHGRREGGGAAICACRMVLAAVMEASFLLGVNLAWLCASVHDVVACCSCCVIHWQSCLYWVAEASFGQFLQAVGNLLLQSVGCWWPWFVKPVAGSDCLSGTVRLLHP